MKNKAFKINLLFPIETSAREFDQRIFMGVKCASKNRVVYVGEQQIIRLLSYVLKRGIFYGKHLFGKPSFSDMSYYKRLKKRFFKLVYLTEEGAVFPGKEDTWAYLLEQGSKPSVLDADDFYLTWGEWQKKHSLSLEKVKAKVLVTGHPRFDLYSENYYPYFEKEVEKIKKEHGDYILFNTSFSLGNNGTGGEKYIFKPTKSYDIKIDSHRKYRFNRYKTQLVAIAETVKLINELSIKFPELTIIIRPHPSENTSLYENIFQNIPNVKVIYDGSVTPWILGCKILMHSGCTTAIEATLANIPAISYSNSKNQDDLIYLAEQNSIQLSDINKIIDFVNAEDFSDNKICEDKLSSSLLHNFENKNTIQQVSDIIDEACKLLPAKSANRFNYLIQKTVTPAYYLYWIVKYIYLFLSRRTEVYTDFKKRFITFDKKDVINKVNIANEIMGTNVKVKFHNKYLFSLIPNKSA